MDEQLKHRLVGAAVLALAVVIFVPMLLDDSAPTRAALTATNIPPRPAVDVPVRELPPDSGTSAPVVESNPPAPIAPRVPPPPASAAPAPAAAQGGAPKPGMTAAPTAAPGRSGVTAWVVQLGSFASEQNALALEKRLKDQGYAAFVDRAPGETGIAFRVRVGPELMRTDADDVRNRVEREIGLKGMVVRYP
ncbi:MAG: SPOR domain-containing protein [Gammaproteobacteria bacterium]